METVQFIQTSPQQLAELIDEKFRESLEDFRKELLLKERGDEILTRQQACEFLQIEQTTLYHWTKAGKVICYGIGNRRYYKRSELVASLKRKV